MKARTRTTAPGFTLVELLTTIAILAILSSLLLAATSSAKSRALGGACLSNMKQFGVAFHLYAGDNEDRILPNLDGKDTPLGQTWVEGWMGVAGPDCTNTHYLRGSLLGAYVSDPKLWRCPASRDPRVGGVRAPRVRTISLNCFMGSPVKAPQVTVYQRLGDIHRPQPSDALVFFEERIDTINDGSFAMDWAFDPEQSQSWMLRDKPAVLHGGGANLTYADGHVDDRRWKDWRTRSAPRDDASTPGNQDIFWMQEHSTWRERAPVSEDHER